MLITERLPVVCSINNFCEATHTASLRQVQVRSTQINTRNLHIAHPYTTVQAQNTVFYIVSPEVQIFLLHCKPELELSISHCKLKTQLYFYTVGREVQLFILHCNTGSILFRYTIVPEVKYTFLRC